jgi:excisionase family DNA binding protein
MDDASITLETLNDKLDNLSRLTLISSKTVLDFDETLLFTGLSRGYLYRLTSEKKIPFFKKNRKLYFKKSDLEEWMLERRVPTSDEIQSKATTYVATHKKN